MALQPRFNLESHYHRPPLEGEEKIKALKQTSEARYIALGKHYHALSLDDTQMREVEDELRKARMFEVTSMTTNMRQMELDEQRRHLLQEQQRQMEEAQRAVVTAQMLRQRALAALQLEAEQTQKDAQEQLAADRQRVIQREREKLMERRRLFELENSGEIPGSWRGPHPSRTIDRDGTSGHTPRKDGPPVLVMNIALGNGKEDKVVVRQNDDPKRVAVAFAQRHKLPEHAVYSLTQQISANLQASAARRSASAAARSSIPQVSSSTTTSLARPPGIDANRQLFQQGGASTPRRSLSYAADR